jgi:hypothetical protein
MYLISYEFKITVQNCKDRSFKMETTAYRQAAVPDSKMKSNPVWSAIKADNAFALEMAQAAISDYLENSFVWAESITTELILDSITGIHYVDDETEEETPLPEVRIANDTAPQAKKHYTFSIRTSLNEKEYKAKQDEEWPYMQHSFLKAILTV